MSMPLFRYFASVGAVLVGLLFLADAWIEKPPLKISPADNVDKSVIRLSSRQTGPGRVDYDVMQPTIVPPAAAEVPEAAGAGQDAAASAPPVQADAVPVAATPAQDVHKEAMARAEAAAPKREMRKSRTKVARAQQSKRQRVASNPPEAEFSFFGNW